jgi:ATP-dependent protease ClpP protease subunit
MRSLRRKFTMRKSGPPSTGDWFRIGTPTNAIAGEADGDTTPVYIYDEIGMWGTSAEGFVEQLMTIKTENIDLHLNTPGGDMFDGLAIFNSLKQHPAHVRTYVDALAASAGSFIALAGEHVVMARNARMMIHDAAAITWGNAEDMREMAVLLDDFSDNIADIYARKAGGDAAEWRELMKAETWYNAKEAVSFGLADEMTDPDEDAEEATDKWDLSLFNHAGRQNAESPFRVRERVRLTMNTNKEAPMGARPTNTEGTPEGTPAEQTGQTDPGTNDEQDTGTGSPDTDPAAEETPGSDDEATGQPAPNTDAPSNRLVPLVVNGNSYEVPAPVAQRLGALELFKTETIENTRRTFVEGLAASNRIAATDIETTTAWALDLSDDQYDTWATMMGKASASALFAQHGINNSESPNPSADAAREQEIRDLEDIVANHRRTGMSEDVLKTKQSYQRLQQLKSEN